MAKSDATELARLISDLQSARQAHVDAIAEIDATFAQFGIEPGPATRRSTKKKASKKVAKKRGRPKGSKNKKTKVAKTAKKSRRGRRGRFGQSAEEFVLSLLKGKKKMTSKEVNQAWTAAGRGGRADTALSNLFKAGKVKRKSIPNSRSSEYSAA